MVKKYSHDEILNAVDRALLKALEESVSSLKIKAGGSLQVALQTISEFIRKRRYENIRRINITPRTVSVSKKRPDIWFFGGTIVVEVKVEESELEKGKKQVENYINEFFRDITVIAIVTNGFTWKFYKVNRHNGVFTLDLINTYYADKTAYESGALLRAITTKTDLYNMIKHMFNQVLAQTQIYRYRPDPVTVYKVFYPILAYVDDIIEIAKKYNIPDKALYSSYKEIMTRLYAGLGKEKMLRLFAVHTLLQAIVNSILTRVLGKDFGDSIRMCSGELLEPYEVSLPHLLWWREVLLEGEPDDKEKLREIFDEIVSYTYLFDWTFETGLDVFSHLYEDFVERALRYKIGEYYTPWWLIELILERLKHIGAPLKNGIVLDPSCGSGRFLVSTFYKKVRELGEDPERAYYTIVGIDINPLATSIARAEMMIAYRYLRGADPPGTPLVFWGDSIGPAIGSRAELINELETINTVLSVSALEIMYNYCKSISKLDALRMIMYVETLLSKILKELVKTSSLSKIIEIINQVCWNNSSDISRKLSCMIIKKFIENRNSMIKIKELVDKYGNHIWAIPIISSFFITAMQSVSALKPDIVVTNPPWLELNELPRSDWGLSVREYVKKTYVNKYKLPAPISQKGDIAIIFLDIILRIVEKGGYVGIVLPAEQVYSGALTSHGVGKILTYTVLNRWKCKGEVLYAGDVFRHGIPASIAIVKKGENNE